MMAVWQTRNHILSLLTLQIVCLFPHASLEVAIKCWWHRVSSVSHNVSIECQADPQGSTLDCALCHLHVIPHTVFSQTGCSHMSASFRALIDVEKIHNTNCTLLCPGHVPGNTPLPCMVQEGYPPPTCIIPFDDVYKNIHCKWTGALNPLSPTDFSLHWRDQYGPNGAINVGGNDSGIIPRDEYTAGEEDIHMWVSAVNTLGSINSETLITTISSITQPEPPEIYNHTFDPLEISYEHNQGFQCQVQHKKLCDQDWTEAEQMFEWNFALEDTVPFTTYKFRVRCMKERAVMSDWSSEYTVETPAAAPVGTLDVWSDCDSTSDDSTCTVLWKEMPQQQARGNITSYMVTLNLRNDTVLNINESVSTSAKTCVQCGLNMIREKYSHLDSHPHQRNLTCPQEQSFFHYCHLSVPVKEVKGIGVTANTALGMSSPALVALPRTDPLQQTIALDIRRRSHELNVSWSVPLRILESVQELVVQQKPIRRPHTPCVNWFRVHKNQTFVTLRGQLSNYTAYNISLFAIVNNRSCLLKSSVVYTGEQVPPKVTDFRVISNSPLTVKLTWTIIPPNKSQEHIIRYLVCFRGVVHNVSSNQSSLELHNLHPDQWVEAWISAETSAGIGERTYTYVTPSGSSGDIAKITGIVTAVLIVLMVILLIMCWSRTKNNKWSIRIPDPNNSSSFRQMSIQFWHSWPVLLASKDYSETISQVEVIPDPVGYHEPEVEQPEEHGELDQSRAQTLQGYGGLVQNNSTLCHQNEYSQMRDSSDDEEEREDEYEWNKQPFISDYETHFLPCTVEA